MSSGWSVGTALALAPTRRGRERGLSCSLRGTRFDGEAAEVPPEVCFVTIQTSGGSGGEFTFTPVTAELAVLTTVSGGQGASVQARFSVNPGDVLDAFVAGVGQNPPTGTDSGHGGIGGLGGGGGGGSGAIGNAAGAGGGGAWR